MFKKTVLPNGLRIITAPMQGTNTITVLVLCGTGSDYESNDIRGMSHFLEHMFFKGTTKRPKQEMITEELTSMGSLHNAFTGHEMTGYYIKAGKTYLEQSLEILSDMYQNSVFPAEEIEREKQVIIEEMHDDHDTPTTYIWWIWEELLYGDQPAGWHIMGKENIIRGFKRDDFVNYFYHQYVSSNTAIVVAGNFDEAKTTELIKSLFGNLRSELPIRMKPFVKEVQTAPISSIVVKKTDQTHITLGFRGLPANHPDRYAADILGFILGGGMSSRMFQRIREKMGLAYTVHTQHESSSNRGSLVTYAGVDHTNTERAISAMLEEYRRITADRVPDAELKRVKDYVKGTTLIFLEASNAVADFIANEEILTGKPLTIDEIFAKIESVTPKDIILIAQKLIRNDTLNLAILGPHEDKEKFEPLLKL
ncbi:MAG: hypothetical protein A3A28_02605 [Candidatus Sungbacteria bacterium RIFCSPLOWO2_01_FULL_47_32]|uniref:Peptidase M16 n=1 Tax=Candidatus Sungbacteria bacterium RIFCSPHIGHO2_01_FULL_47_32 TaxID=1802264 RepID=A0A1G2K4E6_9BACT|nr:MAG: Peptidase M16 domain protein [Parcubacteria group bacterium GW2011_GWA2_47_10]OGZ94292.1 MAG: hypothetical protein A2633_05475 [Candidatus Sungbacteria bacterium RIFCSPHIGHO2_01_FULL_47_32]OGZ99760.1 MAG: hypothetical protein A3D57_02265 [Candidatus Sungbacteria bacterium RIFCSPHIGHO2_02_FULL_46_12]OHA05932.1 MAG: hypothetical protein A3A28_02605 [Candidatus Sungbacteria bacterium RIFCSPLOWO2_01_FULL_47_32]